MLKYEASIFHSMPLFSFVVDNRFNDFVLLEILWFASINMLHLSARRLRDTLSSKGV